MRTGHIKGIVMLNDKATRGLTGGDLSGSDVWRGYREAPHEIQGKRLSRRGDGKGQRWLPRVGCSQGTEGPKGREVRAQAEQGLPGPHNPPANPRTGLIFVPKCVFLSKR